MTIRGPVRIERVIITALIVCFVIYALFEAYKLILGPKIEVLSPQDGSTIHEPVVLIEGKTRNVSFISLNDRRIFVDENGVFREKLLLPSGYTILKISAEDRFKKQTTETLSLFRPYNETTESVLRELVNATTTVATSSVSTSTEDR